MSVFSETNTGLNLLEYTKTNLVKEGKFKYTMQSSYRLSNAPVSAAVRVKLPGKRTSLIPDAEQKARTKRRSGGRTVPSVSPGAAGV